MQPQSLAELVFYKHHYTNGRRDHLSDYDDAEDLLRERRERRVMRK